MRGELTRVVLDDSGFREEFATYDLLDKGADGAVRDGLLGLLRTAIGGMGALVAAA